MASYDYGGYYNLQNNGNGTFDVVFAEDGTAYTAQNLTVTDFSADASFTLNEDVYIDGEIPYTYLGYYGTSIIVQSGASYLLLSDDASLAGTIDPEDGDFITCFLQGTLIATPDGERPVESLAIGDAVVTADGEQRIIRWIGRQDIVAPFADPRRSHPVRIAAGALAEGLPLRDLQVSPDHALLVEGLLVQAEALVNGGSIRRVVPPGRFSYYHVEVADHVLLLAEGVAAESFVDNVSRSRFHNYAEWEALYGSLMPPIQEMDYPRVKAQRQIPPAVRERLAARDAALRCEETAAA